VYVLVGGKLPVITDEDGFFKVQGGRAKKTEEGKYKYKVKYIYLSPYGREEVEKEYEAKGTECVWDKQEIDTRPAWLIGTVKTKRGRHIGGARVETEFGEVDYTNPGGQFKLKAPTNSKVRVYASYGGSTTQVEVQTKEKGSTASVDIILNVDDTPPKIKVLGLGKAKPGGKLKFKIEITDDSDSVGYGVSIKDWGFSDSGTIKLENGRGEKEIEVGVPAGAKSADLEVEAKDTGGNEDRVVMKVEVVEKNRAPEIIRIDVEGEVWIGGRFIASAVAYDPEGDEMSYEWVLTKGEKDYRGWMMVYGATVVVDVPENASGGTYLMKVKVKDSEGGERIFAREIKLTKEVKEGESVCVPSEEICDGLDNDCNGLIDEGVKLVFYKDLDGDGYTDGTTQVGCSAPSGYVLSATSGDCNDNDPNVSPGKTEICDGKDNNCNGQIDEGFNVGQSCTVGVGECARTGQYVCKADGSGTQCNATPGTPTAEICDGKDNDCDGQIDEGIVCSFAKTIGGSENEFAISITHSSDGGYVVAGFTQSFGAGGRDMYVVKLDSSGNVQWTKTIGGSDWDEAHSIIQSSDGGYVVAGRTRSFGAGWDDIYVVKLDRSGNVLWTKTIGGSSFDGAFSIIQSSDGGYVVAGYTTSFGVGYSDIYVVKLDSGGNVQWTKTIGGSSFDGAFSIIQSSDGGYVVAGRTGSFGAGGWDFYVVKLDSSGNVVWTKTIGGSLTDVAFSIIQSSDGGYVVTGWTESFGAGSADIYVVKLDSTGNVIWTKTIGGSLTDVVYSIIQSSDGGYVVAGYTQSFGAGGADIYVVKLDSSGNVVWTKTIGGSYFDWVFSIIQSSDGGYVVAGGTTSFGAGYDDIYVVKMDANGNVCFSQNITNYSVSSNVGSFSSPSTVAISQSPTVDTISPTVSSGGSVSDVCPSSPAPHLNICSANQYCGFGSAIATNKENVKSYGCSVGGVFSRFLIPASMLIVYGQLRKKRKKKKD
jgi:hypothetical protein